MKIKIGAARSFNLPENKKIIPDDRQTKVEVMGGAVVQDYGHVSAGDVISFSALFDTDNWSIIYNYWHSRQLIDYVDENGDIYADCRVVIKSWSHRGRFPAYVTAEIEIWRV